MRAFYLFISVFWTLGALAQQSFFTPENKQAGFEYYKKRIYQGCSDPKEKQDPVSAEEMKKLVNESMNIVQTNFLKAFSENPKVAAAFRKDLSDLSRDMICQKEGNDCRAKLMGLSIYYYQQFRADIPGELEQKFRQSSLQGVHTRSYGAPGAGTYKKALIEAKNRTTMQLFSKIMHKDRTNLHICNNVQSGLVHKYALEMDEPGNYWVGLDPAYDPDKNIPKECVDEKVTLLSEFIPSCFDEGRSKVGLDEVEPVKKRIAEFLKTSPNIIATDVIVTSSSAKTPFYTVINGKKVIDPKSDQRNLSLATDRAMFVKKVLTEIKASNSKFEKLNFVSRAELAGPDFSPMDLNERFVTRMTPGYIDRIDSLFKKNQKIFEEQALIKSSEILMDEKKFVNLFQAKFKPFQGFKIHISGFKKDEMKCLDIAGEPVDQPSSTATKQ